ncbi:MAG: helix-turn-helix transcriptional regulator [Lachnospiraceae bacterium]|nr:helix-turn-helix transcriptional regulator [Lachnospiraceae bacterium]MBQ8947984.1 helix-turn-helix transcriptional regulator [Lachnospiraceae bacterium]
MKLTYDPLWDTLKEKRLKKTDLCERAGLSRSTLAKMGKEEYVALEVVERICNGLSCQVQDVIGVKADS